MKKKKKNFLDSSKQRTRLRKKMASEKTKLKELVDKHNDLNCTDDGAVLTVDDVLAGSVPDSSDHNGGKLLVCICVSYKWVWFIESE